MRRHYVAQTQTNTSEPSQNGAGIEIVYHRRLSFQRRLKYSNLAMDITAWTVDGEDLLRFALSVYRRSRLSVLSHLHERLLPLVVLLFSVYSIALLSAPLRKRRSEINSKEAIHNALLALLRFICPSGRSVWPASYVALARQASRTEKRSFALSIESLLRDVVSGKIELRNAFDDLPALFRGSLSLGLYELTLEVDKGLWSAALCWFSFSQLPHIFYRPAPLSARISEEDRNFHPLAGSSLPHLELTLDGVPCAHVESFVRALQSVCERNQTVIINFTTLDPSVRLWSKELTLCVLPFLSRHHQGTDSDLKYRLDDSKRTAIPLTTSMHKILELLTSENNAFRVVSLFDISADYSARLDRHVQDLEADASLRTTAIDKLGLEGWRQERFMISWEAGLYTAHLLTRWMVVLRK
ncbi:hypothetical protein NEOLEDRAFT_469830 [Neolentinus lepideus HHB14362 ss-1]|uniref:Uncharacterized protein n=1 Tax=Neolentinus lepideus HHB14362 ss-1 TaxID=1314782 RepID=A0A165VIQ4_9AGAM|nr:hypothetical protein NEOLEDRAFT_469830 [Neolentinus lepideus HHB14362 ss-1]